MLYLWEQTKFYYESQSTWIGQIFIHSKNNLIHLYTSNKNLIIFYLSFYSRSIIVNEHQKQNKNQRQIDQLEHEIT